MVKLSVLIFIIASVIATTNAAVLRRGRSGITATVESEKVFCSFLPPKPGENIGDSEDKAIAFCTKKSPNAPGAKIFPDGFIKSAHFKSEGSHVQITGRIDITKYDLNKNDGGGQYDSVGAPPGAVCSGHKKFVNLVEPNEGIYCIRCCNDPKECKTGESTKGCRKIIPGDYS